CHRERAATVESGVGAARAVGRVTRLGAGFGGERPSDEVESNRGRACSWVDGQELRLGGIVLVAENVIRSGGRVGHSLDVVAARLEFLDLRCNVDVEIGVHLGDLPGVTAPPVLDGLEIDGFLGRVSADLERTAADVSLSLFGPVLVT